VDDVLTLGALNRFFSRIRGVFSVYGETPKSGEPVGPNALQTLTEADANQTGRRGAGSAGLAARLILLLTPSKSQQSAPQQS
jgi:hypothetical protein